jgi:hypothetical protein
MAKSFTGDPMAPSAPSPLEAGFGDDALESHAKSMLSAIKRGDVRGLATALRAAVEECYDPGELEAEGGDPLAPPM